MVRPYYSVTGYQLPVVGEYKYRLLYSYRLPVAGYRGIQIQNAGLYFQDAKLVVEFIIIERP